MSNISADDKNSKTAAAAEAAAAAAGTKTNPFYMPSDVGVFALREEDRRLKQEVGTARLFGVVQEKPRGPT